MTRIAIIAAMPGELKPLTRGWRYECLNGVNLWHKRFDDGEWIAACAGTGVDQSAKAFAEVEKFGSVTTAISTGWAGALRDNLVPGQAYDASTVIDARTGERFIATGPPNDCWLVTSPRVADLPEKKRLASTYEAALVDMEAAGIARLARMRGIPFYCIKGISDGYNDQMPDFNRFISPGGQFKLTRFVVFAVLRPWYWYALIRMGENSRKAARNIAQSLLDLLDDRGLASKRNGNPNHQH